MNNNNISYQNHLDPLVLRSIQGMYKNARRETIADFKPACFELIKELIPFDIGCWITGSRENILTTHTVYLYHQDMDMIDDYHPCKHCDGFLQEMIASLGKPIELKSSNLDIAVPTPEFRSHCKLYRLDSSLSTASLDQKNGLYTIITLYRKPEYETFQPHEKAAFELLLPHLIESLSQAHYIQLHRLHESENKGLCDRNGVLLQATPGFYDLLREEWPEIINLRRLPIDCEILLDAQESATYRGRRLIVHMKVQHDLVLLDAEHDRRNPDLTKRQREICKLVMDGHSEKVIASMLCIQVSTVSNHLYCIYQKLNINSRAQLINILSKVRS